MIHYSTEKSIQLLISLLKLHNIRKVVASPGTTNITFVASIMNDPWFEMYSSVDERSAAYIACGLAAESNEPVAISCTGATASRNYLPGLTEAYYSKLPILALTSTQSVDRIGHLVAQIIDRNNIQSDVALLSEQIPATINEDTYWSNTVKINRALLALRHNGGGPVHINIQTTYSKEYNYIELPKVRPIYRMSFSDKIASSDSLGHDFSVNPGNRFPELPKGRIAIFIGRHQQFSDNEIRVIECFCESNNAVVFCDHTSGYNGKYKVLFSIVTDQDKNPTSLNNMDLLIHIGEISGAYMTLRPKAVWRVSPDGELRDFFKQLTYVFEMSPKSFFEHYESANKVPTTYFDECKKTITLLRSKVNTDALPLSNIWVASQTASKLPNDSFLHLGILNTLRSWNFFEINNSVHGFCNTGGFGIDGILSTVLGASLANPHKLHFCFLGDLAFFYDLNSLGNRHITNNIRIVLINNGCGTEFKNYNHPGAAFGDETDRFIAAGGHYGGKSKNLVKHFAQDLGFEYISINSKEEYLKSLNILLHPLTENDKPLIMEVFTNPYDENKALMYMHELIVSAKGIIRNTAKSILGEKGINTVKKFIK